MQVEHYCRRGVVAIEDASDVGAAAQLMREYHVGFLVVYQKGDAARKPIGVLTDRDIVLGVVAGDVDCHAVTVRDAMTPKPLIASETDDLLDLVQAMRLAGVRRVPVVDEQGALTGVIAVDDVIELVATLTSTLSASIRTEQQREWRERR
jgi:CBS domain-containing protein